MKEDKICGKCIYFDPVHKCSENVVGFTGYGNCLKDKKKICMNEYESGCDKWRNPFEERNE